MQHQVEIRGIAPILMHSGRGIDPLDPIRQEIDAIAKRKPRTAPDEAAIRALEARLSFWEFEDRPTIPPAALRSSIERAARKIKEGPLVREGLLVVATNFQYDEDRYGTDWEKLCQTTQFRVPVKIGQSKMMRTRVKFDCPWHLTAEIDLFDDVASESMLIGWLETAGRRIGIGDWRPEKSGAFGRFELASIR